MAEDNAQVSVEIKKSWLKNCDLRTLDDGVVGWGRFHTPDIPESPGDLEHVVGARERPDTIAKKYYGRPEMWWVIAVANGVRLPVAEFSPGRTLRIPDPKLVEDRMEGTGEF